MELTKIILDENEMPKQWYNVLAMQRSVHASLNQPKTNRAKQPAKILAEEPGFGRLVPNSHHAASTGLENGAGHHHQAGKANG